MLLSPAPKGFPHHAGPDEPATPVTTGLGRQAGTQAPRMILAGRFPGRAFFALAVRGSGSAAGGPAVAFAGFPAGENGVKMFKEDPREDSLAERRAEPASV